MRAIDRKLLRDLGRLWAPLGAIALVMGAGVAALVMAISTVESLRTTRDDYYRAQRFADVFAHLKRAPESLARPIAELPGVAALQTRIVHEANLSIPGLLEPATGRLVSIPDRGEPTVSGLHLRQGRLPEPESPREVLVSEPFAQANRLLPGDTIGAVINGRWQRLTIVGIALAPEFIYFVRGGEMLPDNRRSGVLWMRRTALAEALDMQGAFNDLAIRLAPGASPDAVISAVDDLLDPFGGLGAYDRTDHVSDRYLRDEFEQLSVMATVTPAIFLGVGAFLVNVVLGRLVRAQREQIATLKAFGYTRAAVVRHVALMALAVALAAWLVGVAVGWILGLDLARAYMDMFRFPNLTFSPDPAAVTLAAAVAALAGVLGVAGAARWVLRLAPAEAMRPEAPRAFRHAPVEHAAGPVLSVRWRMLLRTMSSHPWRSGLSALGVALSSAVLIVSSFALDALDLMIDREYAAAQRFSATVSFNEPVSAEALGSIAGMLAGEAVLDAEPVRVAAARLRSEHRSRRVGILGLDPGSRLQRLLDAQGRPVEIPPDGLLLSENLAAILGVRPGDTVIVELLEGKRRHLRVRVARVFTGYVGLTAAMNREALNRAAGDGHVISGVHVIENARTAPEFYARLKETPAVASVTSKRGMLQAFRDTIAQHITRITLLHALFGGIIAAGVVYNTARITLAERQRELATLRVLGFSRPEVTRMLLGEVALLTLAGIPAGLVIGRALAWALVQSLQTESYVFPLVVSPGTYAFAALVTLSAAGASAWVVRRSVARLDLLATLKNAG